jgi:hypothetical protein
MSKYNQDENLKFLNDLLDRELSEVLKPNTLESYDSKDTSSIH